MGALNHSKILQAAFCSLEVQFPKYIGSEEPRLIDSEPQNCILAACQIQCNYFISYTANLYPLIWRIRA